MAMKNPKVSTEQKAFVADSTECAHWWCDEPAQHALQDLRRSRGLRTWVRLCSDCAITVGRKNENILDNDNADVILPNQTAIDSLYKWEKIR